MEWSRVGGVLRDNHIFKGNKLSIVNITEVDEGMYVCIAQNRKGVKQATAIVRVTSKLLNTAAFCNVIVNLYTF